MCIFASVEGQVFESALVNEEYKGGLRRLIYYGSDPNPREGYALVGIRYSLDLKHIVVIFAWNFGPNVRGKRALFEYLIPESKKDKMVEVELEDNGVGKVVWDDYIDEGGKGMRVDWGTSGAGDKVARSNEMNKKIIHIWHDNPNLSTEQKKFMKMLWSQMNGVQWTKDGSKIDKDTNKAWHLSDSLMHSCSFGQQASMVIY